MNTVEYIENIYKNKTTRNRILIYLCIIEYIKKLSGYKMKYIAKCIILNIKVGAAASPFKPVYFNKLSVCDFTNRCLENNINKIRDMLLNPRYNDYIYNFLSLFFRYYDCSNIKFAEEIINTYKDYFSDMRIILNYKFHKNKYIFDKYNIKVEYSKRDEGKNLEKAYNLARWNHPIWKYIIKGKINNENPTLVFNNILIGNGYYDEVRYLNNNKN